VRIARTQIICLQNDLKELTKSIEDGLEKFFIENKDKIQNTLQPGSSSSTTERPTTNDQNDNLQPFVIVNLVSPQSPAEEAGIEVRDLILSFGSIQKTNFKDLAQVGELVKNSIDQEIHVKVRRNGKVEELILIPKAWSGRGFLGCNIVPMPTI
jgi:26S proteasome regulatory subunit N4